MILVFNYEDIELNSATAKLLLCFGANFDHIKPVNLAKFSDFWSHILIEPIYLKLFIEYGFDPGFYFENSMIRQSFWKSITKMLELKDDQRINQQIIEIFIILLKFLERNHLKNEEVTVHRINRIFLDSTQLEPRFKIIKNQIQGNMILKKLDPN